MDDTTINALLVREPNGAIGYERRRSAPWPTIRDEFALQIAVQRFIAAVRAEGDVDREAAAAAYGFRRAVRAMEQFYGKL